MAEFNRVAKFSDKATALEAVVADSTPAARVATKKPLFPVT